MRIYPNLSRLSMQVGDQVLRFGSLDLFSSGSTSDIMSTLPSVVQHSVGRSLSVVVRRPIGPTTLQLTPHAWSGRGLLGCHLTPLPLSS